MFEDKKPSKTSLEKLGEFGLIKHLTENLKMNLKFFIIFIFFIQFGFSQDSLMDKLRDTIIVDKNFIRQLDNKFIKTVNFKIDASILFLDDKEFDTTSINVLFINKTKSYISVSRIGGGSNYFCNYFCNELILFPNEKKSIKMTLGVNRRTKWSRSFSFALNGGDVKSQRVCRYHHFELINKKPIIKK